MPSGLELGDALGHQFADDDGDVGDDDDHEARGKVAAEFLVQAQTMQPGGEGCRQNGLADDTVEDADRGNADLDGRQEARRFVVQRQGNAGSTVAILGQSRQSRATCGDERDFRHGKCAVKQDKTDQ